MPDRREHSLASLLSALSRERDEDGLLGQIARELAEHPRVALARLWRLRPGDRCHGCPQRGRCPGSVPCLQLAACAGDADAESLDEALQRVPIGAGAIGRAGLGEMVNVADAARDDRTRMFANWARREQIRGLGVTPLADGAEVMGALAVFQRSTFDRDDLEWLRSVAEIASAFLGRTRAVEEERRQWQRRAVENACLREAAARAGDCGVLAGASAARRALTERIERAASLPGPVLIEGEPGTGTLQVAHEIHSRGPRAASPLISVDCASLAREHWPRFAAAARDATLCVHEVTLLPADLQADLLEQLHESRVVATTCRDLRREVDLGRFREDLYYRLEPLRVWVPPLRERRRDIAQLATLFAERAARRLGRPKPVLTHARLAALERYDWPGNARELESAVERAVAVSTGGPLDVVVPAESAGRGARAARSGRGRESLGEATVLSESQLRQLARENTLAALRRTRWRVAGPRGAAALLGVRPTTLASRMRQWGLERPV